MKNFTNNFKQFTSRLSARWLIMALMMLVGTSSAWGATVNGVIYFEKPNANWGTPVLCLGKSDGSQMNFTMELHCGNIYKKQVTWGDGNATCIAFTDCTGSWGWEENSLEHRLNYISGNGTYKYDINSNPAGKIFKPGTATGNAQYSTGKLYSWDGGYAEKTFSESMCCSAPTSVSISRGAPTSGNICEDSTIDLTATVTGGSGIISYSWTKTSGGSDWSIANSTSQKCTVTAGTGSATFKITATRCGTSKTSTVTLTADAKPSAPNVDINGETTATICSNSTATITASAVSGATQYSLYKGNNNSASQTNDKGVFEVSDAASYRVSVTTKCGESSKSSFVTLKHYTEPSVPEADVTSETSCNGTPNNDGSISITPESGVTYTLTKEGTTYTATNNSSWSGLAAGNYTLTATLNACNDLTDEETITVNLTDNTPTIGNISILGAGSFCNGTTATLTCSVDAEEYQWYKNDAPIQNETSKTLTVTVTADASYKVEVIKTSPCRVSKTSLAVDVLVLNRPEAPKFTTSSETVCEGQRIELPTPTNMGSYEIAWSIKDAKNTPVPVTLTETTIFCAVLSNNGCLSDATEFTVNVNKIPTISGPTYTQPSKANAITLTAANGILANWSVDKDGDLSQSINSNTTDFSAENNGTYTITATNGTGLNDQSCSATHVVTVSDAFYIWVRNAKESDTAYGQFYYPNENSEAVRGGAMFYAECDALPTKDNYTTYNRGGRKADIVNDDCDGYTWYGFKASADVIAGTKYFYVHATNDLSDGGYYTHSKPLKSALSGDVYYTLGTTGDSYSGWNLSTASAPYAGPVVHASGDATLGTNKFAALYVTDCSGKEVTTYQWEYSSTQNGTYNPYSASVSNSGTLYSGDAGKTNNIRPSVAGYYRCKVTYKDASTATSEPVQVTGTYSYTESSLPVFVVNTNGEGFPVNDCSGTPSKNADNMKAKVSVDVKIYQNETMVYDRKARMNYRGSSSLNFLKKSYAFCPGKANCVEDKGRQDYVKTEKMNMLNVGSAEDKDWVLYAAAPDPSLMRNRLVFDTYKEMTGKWGVSSRFVKLYVDGTYKGIYVLMDKITNNKKRVNITHPDGFIVKFDKTDKVDRVGGYQGVLGDEKTFKTTRTGADDLNSYDTSIDQRFEIEYPEKDDYPTGWSAKVNSIKAMFEGFENALAAKDFATVQKYIDYDSWADWFIISEYAKNVDAYRASCIFVYNGDKIEATPLWDQELSFNNQTMLNHGNNDATGLLVTSSSIYGDSESFKAPFWFTNKGTDINNITGGLLSDPCFVQVVKEKWNQYSTGTGALTADALNAKIKAYTDELDDATDVSFNRGTMDCGSCQDGACKNWGTGYSNSINKSGSIKAIDTWIKDRGNGLTNAINKLTGASFSIQILPSEIETTPWEATQIAVNVTPEGYDYVLEYTDNNLGGVTNIIIEENGNEMTYRIPRPASWSTGNEATEGERADIEYGIKATLNVASGTIVCGSQAAPTSTAKIILQDEPNENCPQP